MKRITPLALAVWIVASSPAAASDWLHLNLVLDGRLVTTPPSRSFLEAGLGKTRYGHEPRAVEAKLAQAAFLARVEVRPDLTLHIHANFDAEHDFRRRADLVEALVRYAPALSDASGVDIRAGLFFPTVSLENTDPGWLSPYTTTFSAINSWIGEEVRSLGVEAGPTLRAREAQIRLFGAATRQNDPNGTLLAWRGFALHDRVSGFADRIPLSPLKSFGRSGLFPDQPPHVQPLRELDRRWTWSSGLSVTHPQYRIKALYQPQTANPKAFDGVQYAWRTGYLALGAARSFGPVEVLAQGLDGETRMGIASGDRNGVVVGFRAAYGLVTWSSRGEARHRATVRYDRFEAKDRDDFKVQDPNDESGSAWTFAYAFAPNTRHHVTVELLRVDSTRTNRRDLGLAPRLVDLQGTLSWRLSF